VSTMTMERPSKNISVVGSCPKCHEPAYAGGTCRKCGTELPSNKVGDARERDLVEELVDKRRIAVGFTLLNLSETREGEYSLD